MPRIERGETPYRGSPRSFYFFTRMPPEEGDGPAQGQGRGEQRDRVRDEPGAIRAAVDVRERHQDPLNPVGVAGDDQQGHHEVANPVGVAGDDQQGHQEATSPVGVTGDDQQDHREPVNPVGVVGDVLRDHHEAATLVGVDGDIHGGHHGAAALVGSVGVDQGESQRMTYPQRADGRGSERDQDHAVGLRGGQGDPTPQTGPSEVNIAWTISQEVPQSGDMGEIIVLKEYTSKCKKDRIYCVRGTKYTCP